MSRFAFPDAPGDLIGAHLSTKGGLHTIFDRATEINASSAALFAKNGNQWKGKDLTDADCAFFNEQRTVRPLLTHASYLINLASTDDVVHRKSIAAMTDELDRAERLGIHAVVLHPGAHLGAGNQAGIDKIARSLDQVHALIPNHRVVTLLETAAGQGTCLGCTFEELGQMIKRVDDKRRVGICFDTCHVFAAGYDLRTRDGYERTIDEMAHHVGLENVGAFHLNDSKKPLGSRVDRHTHIGEGELGLEPFRFLLNDPRFKYLPKVIETPKPVEHESDRRNLEVLRGLVGTTKSQSRRVSKSHRPARPSSLL
jgi:deoxyribonuclease IV